MWPDRFTSSSISVRSTSGFFTVENVTRCLTDMRHEIRILFVFKKQIRKSYVRVRITNLPPSPLHSPVQIWKRKRRGERRSAAGATGPRRCHREVSAHGVTAKESRGGKRKRGDMNLFRGMCHSFCSARAGRGGWRPSCCGVKQR